MRTVIGLIWLLAGGLLVLRPEVFRGWVRWRSERRIRAALCWLSGFAGVSMLLVGLGFSGMLAKLLIIFGMAALVKAWYFHRCESADWVVRLLAELPETAYRWYGLVWLVIGLLLVLAG